MQTHLDVADVCVRPTDSVREAALRMDRRHLGIVMVVDARGRLLGTVTDGDLRRAMLARIPLDAPVKRILDKKKGTAFAKPVSGPVEASREECLARLKEHNLLHLPLLDKARRVVGLASIEDLVLKADRPVRAVVMAGGKGTRLFPLTKDTPKPMLPVGDKPLLETIFQRLRSAGIKHVKVTTHHKREKITDHFGDGGKLGMDLSYIYEDKPLGTAGALGLMGKHDETTLVMNGDVLTQLDFRAMLKYHREAQAELTAAVCQYELKVPYGVVESDGLYVTGLKEKPTLHFFVSAGIYLLEPSAVRSVPKGRRFDMTDLISRLVAQGRKVASFPIREYWLDIGRPEDYERAQKEAAKQ